MKIKNRIHVFAPVDVNVPDGHNITSCKSQLFIKYSLTLSYPDDEPFILVPSNITVAHRPFIFKLCIIICKNNTSEFAPPAFQIHHQLLLESPVLIKACQHY